MNMKSKQIYLTIRQNDILVRESKEKGISISEVIRRILDEWIDKNVKVIQDRN